MDDNEKNVKKESFWYKYKNDKKYNAKIQLVVYALFIIIVVVYVNTSHVGNNYNYDNSIDSNGKISENSVGNVLDNINSNYNYLVEMNAKIKKDNNHDEDVKYTYKGKSVDENMIIEINNSETFYKVSSEYYIKNEDNYKFIDVSTVYELISYKYIELDSVKKFIKKAILDHVDEEDVIANYSYNLLVKDVIQSYNGEDVVPIKINVVNNVYTIEIDYSNLFKEMYNDIVFCNIKYTYSDVNNVEKFVIIENNEN